MKFKEFFHKIYLPSLISEEVYGATTYCKPILEFSEKATRKIIQKFQNDASEEEIRREVRDFEKYKQSIQKKDPFQYKSWIEFTEAIHAAKGKSEFKKKKAPTQEITANREDIIADDENVTIYRGDSQDKCVLYGRGYTFCISRQAGGNMYSNYRLGKESTFYFIYFKKKSKSEKDHIMVLDHTNRGYEWTFADNDTQEVKGGWQEIVGKYPELDRYEKLLVNKNIDDSERAMLEKLKDFVNNTKLSTFEKFSYKEKAQALKSVANIPDEIWKVLDTTLRNEFLSIGPNLTEFQANDLELNEIKRYKNTRKLSIHHLLTIRRAFPNKFDSDDVFISTSRYHDNALLDLVNLKYNNTNVPNNVIEKMLMNGSPRLALKYAIFLIENAENVPDIVMDSIVKDATVSLEYAKSLIRNNKDVPERIIQGVLFWNKTTLEYIQFLIDNNKEDDGYLLKILTNIKHEESISKSLIDRASTINFDKVSNAIRTKFDSSISQKYAEYLITYNKDIPDLIINNIAKNSFHATYHARNLNNKDRDVPDIIINSIAKIPESASEYINQVIWSQKGNIPDIIIDSVARNSKMSLECATSFIRNDKNVPDIIVNSIAKVSKNAYRYAEFLINNNKEVPNVILDSIAKDAQLKRAYITQYSYHPKLKGLPLPIGWE